MTPPKPATSAGRALLTGEATRQLFHAIDGRRDALIKRILAIEAEAAAQAEARIAALEGALRSEDEIAHGEAWHPQENRGLGRCAYCDDEWPCRTQRGIDRALSPTSQSPEPPQDAELDALLAGYFDARRSAILNVVAHKASPPEYPGLALVPVSDIERLERFVELPRTREGYAASGASSDHFHDPFDPTRHAEWLSALGHKPLPDGHCEHRWRNRTRRAVRCAFLDGFRAGLTAPPEDE